jgi:hypothetical protein
MQYAKKRKGRQGTEKGGKGTEKEEMHCKFGPQE